MSDLCKPCLARGHQCEARDVVDGEPWCIFCMDGVDCPIMQRKTTSQFNSDFIDRKLKEHREPTKAKESNSMEEKKCKTCGKTLSSINESGYCAKHFYDSKRKGPAQSSPPPQTVRQTAKRTAKSPESGMTLTFTEAQIDRFFGMLPVERKFQLVSSFLSLSD